MKIAATRTVWVNQYGDTTIKTFGLVPGERDSYVAYKHNSTETSEQKNGLKQAKGWIYGFRTCAGITWKELTIKTRI